MAYPALLIAKTYLRCEFQAAIENPMATTTI
jgi:hypothetical protein